MQTMEKRIITELKSHKRNPITKKLLAQFIKVKKNEYAEFSQVLNDLCEKGIVLEQRRAYVLSESMGLYPATVIKVNETFGFILVDGETEDMFVAGKLLKGAMPDDRVLVKKTRSARRTSSEEAEVVQIIKTVDRQFTGVVKRMKGKTFVVADKFIKTPLEVMGSYKIKPRDGEKVLAAVISRGKRHSEHRVEILKSFGCAEDAYAACDAVLAENEIPLVFPDDALEQAKNMNTETIDVRELDHRLDLRYDMIFTIDGADTKDIDDAISLEKNENGWYLGVHIADVSHYVRYNTPIDKEAYNRGTSVYYADRVIPMLPKELSNGICSLNPNEDRLAFSALVTLDKNGKIKGYNFAKTVIRSRIKGVYSEINAVLDGSASEEIQKKYSDMKSTLLNMRELANILSNNQIKRGGFDLDSAESKIIIGEDREIIDIVPRKQGESEKFIEEFMIVANEAAATFAKERKIPFVYRVHQSPPATKLQALHQVLTSIGIDAKFIEDGVEPRELAKVLNEVRGTDLEDIVNHQVLRSMAKAVYSNDNIGHYGLVLDNYSHFTSPIRRYPDLIIHRIMSAYLANTGYEKLVKRYSEYVGTASKHCSDCEIRAMIVERDCEDCYKAEFMKKRIGMVYDGIISSVAPHGIYVALPNTVEGMIHVSNLPEGDYVYDGNISMVEKYSNVKYRVGDKIKILVLSADVSSGKIDFAVAQQ